MYQITSIKPEDIRAGDSILTASNHYEYVFAVTKDIEITDNSDPEMPYRAPAIACSLNGQRMFVINLKTTREIRVLRTLPGRTPTTK